MISSTVTMHTFEYGNQKLKYNLVRSKRRKTSEIIVDENELTLRIPYDKSTNDARKLLESKIEWIVRKQKEYKERKPEIIKPNFLQGSTLPYLGKNYEIKIVGNSNGNEIELEEDKFLINLDVKKNILSIDIKVKSLYEDWLYRQAKRIFRDKIKEFSTLVHVRPKKIILKNLKNRWGSVTKQGTINLNYNLIKAPEDIIDYIVIHELCHFHIKKHSYHYWALLKQYVRDYKSKIEWLDVNGKNLIDTH